MHRNDTSTAAVPSRPPAVICESTLRQLAQLFSRHGAVSHIQPVKPAAWEGKVALVIMCTVADAIRASQQLEIPRSGDRALIVTQDWLSRQFAAGSTLGSLE